jgi:predicted DsbA family dithiol-disulfide isomerase
MARATWLERRFGARIDWLPFDLHPEYPPEGVSRGEMDRRYGGSWTGRLSALFEGEGLSFADSIARMPRSFDALRVSELARERGRHNVLHARLMDAFWARGRDLGDHRVLVEECVAVDLREDEVRDVLERDRYAGLIAASTAGALDAGATGVPAFAIDDRVLIPGAQPQQFFEEILRRLGYAATGAES